MCKVKICERSQTVSIYKLWANGDHEQFHLYISAYTKKFEAAELREWEYAWDFTADAYLASFTTY